MEEINNIKPKSVLLYVLIGILCLTIFSGLIFWQYKRPDRKSDANQNTTTTTPQPESLNTDSQFDQKTSAVPPSTSTTTPNTNATNNTDPYYYYDLGLKQTVDKQYVVSIANFQKAIDLKPTISEFYSKKAEAEVLNGQKDQAIQTIQVGLKNIPDDPTLKNKLNILQTVVQ